jgi:hypothetical protein
VLGVTFIHVTVSAAAAQQDIAITAEMNDFIFILIYVFRAPFS